MVQHTRFEGFNNTNLGLKPQILLPNISDDIMQALARLMAWNSAQKRWDILQLDNNGRLLVSNSNVGGIPAQQFSLAVNATNQQILAANSTRKALLIQNQSSIGVFLGLGYQRGAANGFLLQPGASFYDDSLICAIYGSPQSGATTVEVVEY